MYKKNMKHMQVRHTKDKIDIQLFSFPTSLILINIEFIFIEFSSKIIKLAIKS